MNLIVLKIEKQRLEAKRKEREFEEKFQVDSKTIADLSANWDKVPNKKLHRLN